MDYETKSFLPKAVDSVHEQNLFAHAGDARFGRGNENGFRRE